jgi:delta1-piperideine-2-carboxylate reductase
MRVALDEAGALLESVMRRLGHDAAEAAVIADHLLDSEIRGFRQGGLARALSIAERLARPGRARSPMRVTHETAVAARLDGGDNVGYLVGRRAMELALSKVRAHGIAMVAAHNTWYTGMLSYYAEMAVADGKVAMIASNATAWVAPHGATEGRFGTNPICFGFPGEDAPVIAGSARNCPKASPTTPPARRPPIPRRRSPVRWSRGAAQRARGSGSWCSSSASWPAPPSFRRTCRASACWWC